MRSKKHAVVCLSEFSDPDLVHSRSSTRNREMCGRTQQMGRDPSTMTIENRQPSIQKVPIQVDES